MFKSPRLKSILALCLLLIFGALIWGWLAIFSRQRGLPNSTVKAVNFPLYYPNKLPANYSLDKSTVQVENQIVFFSISDKDRKVAFSEQAIPKTPPDFSTLVKYNPSFVNLDVLAGNAVVGVDPVSQSPIAIAETNTTLINVSGNKGTPLDTINKLIQSLSSLPQ